MQQNFSQFSSCLFFLNMSQMTGGVVQPINIGSSVQLSVTPIIAISFEVNAWWLLLSLNLCRKIVTNSSKTTLVVLHETKSVRVVLFSLFVFFTDTASFMAELQNDLNVSPPEDLFTNV